MKYLFGIIGVVAIGGLIVAWYYLWYKPSQALQSNVPDGTTCKTPIGLSGTYSNGVCVAGVNSATIPNKLTITSAKFGCVDVGCVMTDVTNILNKYNNGSSIHIDATSPNYMYSLFGISKNPTKHYLLSVDYSLGALNPSLNPKSSLKFSPMESIKINA